MAKTYSEEEFHQKLARALADGVSAKDLKLEMEGTDAQEEKRKRKKIELFKKR